MPAIKSDSKLRIRERITPYLTIERSCKSLVHEDKDEHESMIVEDDGPFGLCLFMNNYIQSAEIDSHIYHESLVQPAMCLSPCPKRVLIGGGGELVTAYEVLKHKSVEKCDMVDIDGKVVEMAKQRLEKLHFNGYKDKRLNLVIDDVYKFVVDLIAKGVSEEDKYDVVIMDICDPTEGYGPARLYTVEFYELLKKVMKPDGVFVTQSTALQHTLYMSAARIRKTAAQVFGGARLYRSFVPSFLENWGFTIAGPSTVRWDELARGSLSSGKSSNSQGESAKEEACSVDSVLASREVSTKYYDQETHIGMFCCLGKDLRELVNAGSVQVATEENVVMYLSKEEASENLSDVASPSSGATSTDPSPANAEAEAVKNGGEAGTVEKNDEKVVDVEKKVVEKATA